MPMDRALQRALRGARDHTPEWEHMRRALEVRLAVGGQAVPPLAPAPEIPDRSGIRSQRAARKRTPRKLRPASLLHQIYTAEGERVAAEWAEEQRQRALAGLPPEPPPEIATRIGLSEGEFDEAHLYAPISLTAIVEVMFDPEVRQSYAGWIHGRSDDESDATLYQWLELPLLAWLADIAAGDAPDPERLKVYAIEHASEVARLAAELREKSIEAQTTATLARPLPEPPAPFEVTTAEGETVEMLPHVRRGPVTKRWGERVPHGVVPEDPRCYSAFLSPDDPRHWGIARAAKEQEARRLRMRQLAYQRALAETPRQPGDERRADYWRRVYDTMRQIGEWLFTGEVRKRLSRHRRETFGYRGPGGTYHAGTRRKRR